MPPPLLGIAEGQQDLRDRDVMARQRLLIGVGQADLAGRGRGLLLLEAQRSGGEAEMTPPDRDGAGRNQDHIGAALAQRRDVVGQRIQPFAPDAAALLVDQQGRADLDDQALGAGEAGGGPALLGHCAASMVEDSASASLARVSWITA